MGNGLRLEDLKGSKKQRLEFERFCAAYNGYLKNDNHGDGDGNGGGSEGKEGASSLSPLVLESGYRVVAEDLPKAAMDQCGGRTSHCWNIRATVTEERGLNVVKEGVRKQTEYHGGNNEVVRNGGEVMIGVGRTTIGAAVPSMASLPRAKVMPRAKTNPITNNSNSNNNNNYYNNNNNNSNIIKAKTESMNDDKEEKAKRTAALLESMGLSNLVRPGQGKISIAPRK